MYLILCVRYISYRSISCGEEEKEQEERGMVIFVIARPSICMLFSLSFLFFFLKN